MDSKSSGSEDVESLGSFFDSAFTIHTLLENSSEPTNSNSFQEQVKKAVNLLEEATRRVSTLGIFSSNEDVEEIATIDLKFFLLPAILGSLTSKLTTVDRSQVLEVAQAYYEDFLIRCKNYGIIDVELKFSDKDSSDQQLMAPSKDVTSVLEMSKIREEKIRRYKEVKTMEKKISDLKTAMAKEITDEAKREYYLTLIKFWASQSLEELSTISLEKPILEQMKSVKSKHDDLSNVRGDKVPIQSLKPIIITRNDAQKKIFGLGYPSLPTMTIDEFYEQKVKDGTFSVPDMSLQALAQGEYNRQHQKELDDIENEVKIEKDDPTALKTARDWDEWKDDHRRGWGNRKNMG